MPWEVRCYEASFACFSLLCCFEAPAVGIPTAGANRERVQGGRRECTGEGTTLLTTCLRGVAHHTAVGEKSSSLCPTCNTLRHLGTGSCTCRLQSPKYQAHAE